mmetsp:Transcript_20487/g.36351  ORF Transcript_20487/g.36351 Transcript_20487/m.36351 type:complete len:237 (+) Transcript_20487:47-757(+)
MPVEAWFQCSCSLTRPGDRLVAVGDHPALGCWSPSQSSVVLKTFATTFPVWQVSSPVLLADRPGCLGKDIEYKYVILRADSEGEALWEEMTPSRGKQWELSLSCLGFESEGYNGESDVQLSVPDDEEIALLVNRRFSPHDDSICFRSDSFGVLDPIVSMSWLVGGDWGPGLAGCSDVIGRGNHRNSRNPQFRLQYRLPLQLFVETRRGRLQNTLAKLRQRLNLPPGLMTTILSYVG